MAQRSPSDLQRDAEDDDARKGGPARDVVASAGADGTIARVPSKTKTKTKIKRPQLADEEVVQRWRQWKVKFRAAVLYLLKFGAAFEGRGLPAPVDPAVVKKDLGRLSEIVDAILGHRDQAMKRRLKADGEELARLVAVLYAKAYPDRKRARRGIRPRNVTQESANSAARTRREWLLDQLRTATQAAGYTLTERQLDVLAIDESALDGGDGEVGTTWGQGPVQTARHFVLKVTLGIGITRWEGPRHRRPSIFGRWPSAKIAGAYGRQLLRWAPPEGDVEHMIAMQNQKDEREIGAQLGAMPEILAAIGRAMTGEEIDIADIPTYGALAEAHPAVRGLLTRELTHGLGKDEVNARDFERLSKDRRFRRLTEQLVEIWNGRNAPPLTYDEDAEPSPRHAADRRAGGSKRRPKRGERRKS
jgi:hypothetical protein